MRPVVALALAAALLTLGLACGKDKTKRPTAPVDQPPAASSPGNALLRLEWSWNHRDSLTLSDVLADDFLFVYSVRDSNGQPQPVAPMGRDEMLCTAGRLFHGGGLHPLATAVRMDLGQPFVVAPDPRPGMDSTWHKAVLTSLDLTIALLGGGTYESHGVSNFYLVRGDSAQIPFDLRSRGILPDSTRWFVTEWDDVGTASLGPSLGEVFDLYRCKPGPLTIVRP